MRHKLCLFTFALVLGLMVLGGCQQEVTTPAALTEAPVSLDWYINFSWFSDTWGEDAVARAITAKTGTAINFITPAGNEWDKLNSLMAADTLPDLITLGYWEPQIGKMIRDGQVHALNQLADQYAPGFWQVADPLRVAWYTRQDGNLYAYPNSSYTPEDYQKHANIGSNQAFLVRKDLYEALGRPDMTTPEGFYAAIEQAARLYPEVEGKPLLPIGLYDFDKDGCFSLENILMNLLAIPFEDENGLVDRYTHPDYLTWLKTFRRLYQDGYLPADIFIDKRVQTAEKVSQGRYFCLIYQHTDIADQQKLLYTTQPGAEYIAVDGPQNSQGDPHVLPGVGINGWTLTLISKKCQNPEKAIQMMAYMMSEEGQLLLYCGVEGVTYDWQEGKPVIYPEVQALLNRDRVAYNRLYGADNTYWMLQDSPMQLAWQQEQGPPLAQPRQWTYPYTAYTAHYEYMLESGSFAENAHGKIREEWGATLPRLLMAASDAEFDRIFAEFLQKRQELGFEIVQAEAQKLVDQAKRQLGL